MRDTDKKVELKMPPEPVQGRLALLPIPPTSRRSSTRLDDMIAAAQEIENTDPWTARTVGYAARCFVQVFLPHSIRSGNQYDVYTRQSGDFILQIKPDAKYGIPYGTIPRLLLIWMADEVRRTKEPTLELGKTLSKFMANLGIVPTGGQSGTVTRLRDQMRRLFNCDIRYCYRTTGNEKGKLFAIEESDLWWDRSSNPVSTIQLSTPLFKELLSYTFPVDMRAIRVLRRSPMEMDVYCWGTYRVSYLDRPIFLSYQALALQFGAQYKKASNFRLNLDRAAWAVQKQYPKLRIEIGATEGGREGWRLLPSPTHVPQLGNTRHTGK